MTPANPVPIALVVGNSFSGSTLLSMLVDHHPDVLSVGEASVAFRYVHRGVPCTCGEPVSRCPFFARVAARLHREHGLHVDMDAGDLRYRPSDKRWGQRLLQGHSGIARLDRLRDDLVHSLPRYRRRRAERRRVVAAWVRIALEEAGARVFFDATKHDHRIPFLAGAEGVRLSIVHLVRDPRAYVVSARRNERMPLAKAIRTWRAEHEGVASHLARWPHLPVHRLHYEALCADPDAELAALHRFLDVEPQPPPADFTAGEHHVLGNRSRLKKGPGVIRVDRKWTTLLSPRDEDRVLDALGDQARALGLPMQPRPSSDPTTAIDPAKPPRTGPTTP